MKGLLVSRSMTSGSAICFIILVAAMMVPAHGVDVTVSFSQEDTTKEPFDVAKSLNYNVLLSNAAHTMRYTIEITAGPDISDPSISKTFSSSINLNSGQSGSAEFVVNYQAPEMRGGDFGRWLMDANDTSVWESAWYKVTVTSLDPFEKPVIKEDYTGRPKLVKLIELFKDPIVTPSKGTNEDLFEYKVSVYSTAEDSITLEVGPTRDGPWTAVGVRDYTVTGSWTTLNWSDVTLDFDFTSAFYHIKGRKEATFEGPFWPVDVEFKNQSVTPDRGLYNSQFTYSLRVNASKEIEVGLNVWDVGTKEYKSLGKLAYNNVSKWENLTWKDMTITSIKESSGTSSYYFSFYYVGADQSFSTTEEVIRKYYPGPDVAVISLKNVTVTPANATIYTAYTYSIEVETSKPRCDIELLIAKPGSSVFNTRGTVTYDEQTNTDVLTWHGIKFDADNEVVGNARYRFIWSDMVLGEYVGPDIDVTFKNVTWNRIENTDRFNYNVSVRSSCKVLPVELLYTDDGVIWSRSGLVQNYTSENQEWQALEWSNQPWHQTVRFDIVR